MVTSFNCKCGNTDTTKVYEHDGMLGYEALVCRVCGIYYDHTGEHPADDFSKQFIIVEPTLRQLILKRIEEIRKMEHGFPKEFTRWQNFSTGTDKTHISDMKFEEMNDYDLLFLFERIIRKMSKYM